MPKSTTYLPDVNFWLAMLFDGHQHHQACRGWWEGAGRPELVFIRETKNALLRLLTNRSVMSDEVLTASQAWRVADQACSLREVGWLGEPAGADEAFRRHSGGLRHPGGSWTDSWLLAVAEAAGFVVVTCDQGLARRGAGLVARVPAA